MKLERISENEIHCTLESSDLQQRNIQLSELSYGSEKTKLLFQEILQKAGYEFDFDTKNIPLMLEAIPMENDSIVLIITRVEEADELDTRFARFAPNQLELLEYEEDLIEEDDDEEEEDSEYDYNADSLANLLSASALANMSKTASLREPTQLFPFSNIDDISLAVHTISHIYQEDSALYYDPQLEVYFLTLHSKDSDSLEKISAQMGEYSCLSVRTPSEVYCQEHFQTLIAHHAVQELDKL